LDDKASRFVANVLFIVVITPHPGKKEISPLQKKTKNHPAMKQVTMDTRKQTLARQAKETGASMLAILADFSDQQLNARPSCGGWTAGQVAEHLLLSGGVVETIAGRTAPTTDRPADARCPIIAGIFLNFHSRLQSPDFILPSEDNQDKQRLISLTRLLWDRIGEGIRVLDLSQTCLDFEFPTIGYLTRLELLWFYVWHTQRHIHQLNRIQRAVASVPA
jgi:hypothetical protein